MLDQNIVRMIAQCSTAATTYNSHLSLRGAVNEGITLLKEKGLAPKGFSKLEKEYKEAAMNLILDTTLPKKLNTPEVREMLKNQRTSNKY